MNKFTFAVAGLLVWSGLAFAQPGVPAAMAPGASGCEARAIDKNGNKLAGAARNAFVKKCEADYADPAMRSCQARAVGKNGKALAGAAKSSFMKKCTADMAKA